MSLFFKFSDWVKQTQCECRQTDWGCRVAKVTKAQIKEFIEFCYGHDEGSAGNRKKLEELKACVETLDEGQLYGLVARET